MSINSERWVPAFGFEEAYSVSESGLLRSEKDGRGTVKGLILKPRYTVDGYIKYALQHKRRRQQVLCHRLVYQSFVRPLSSDEEIDHLNGQKQDNRLCNLEPVTKLENMQRSFLAGRNMARGEDVRTSKLTVDVVHRIREMFRSGKKQTEICEAFSLTKSIVNNVVHRRTWKHVA